MKGDRMDLTEFLLARIAEDEAVARSASTKHGRWEVDDEDDHPDPEVAVYPERGGMTTIARTWRTEQGHADAEHIARHDPARALAECEAKRRIIAEHAPTQLDPDDERLIAGYCRMCVGESGWPVKKGQVGVGVVAPCLTARLLALPYAEHPDYRPEWRP